jgi:DHA2 family multidrug resistance protein
MTSPDVKAPEAHPILTTHPLLGVAGFLLGAMIATCTGRLMSVGLADIRDALARPNFGIAQAVMAVGLALALNSMVGSIVLELLDTGALTRPIDVLTFAGFFQTVRLFGGELGGVFMGHFIAAREQFHSNMLGLNVQLRNVLTDHRLFGLGHAFAPHSTGPTSLGRGAQVLGLQVRQQAFTLAISDSFLLVAACCVACLVVVALMSTVPTQYRQVVAAPAEAK